MGICFYKARLVDGGRDIVSIHKNINRLRGIFALFIIFTHCTLPFDNLPVLLLPLRKVSTFGVGFFFVLSGYGLAYSYEYKENYLKKEKEAKRKKNL